MHIFRNSTIVPYGATVWLFQRPISASSQNPLSRFDAQCARVPFDHTYIRYLRTHKQTRTILDCADVCSVCSSGWVCVCVLVSIRNVFGQHVPLPAANQTHYSSIPPSIRPHRTRNAIIILAASTTLSICASVCENVCVRVCVYVCSAR